MENPFIIVLSSDQVLVAELPDRMQGAFELQCYEELDDAGAAALESSPSGMVVDFTDSKDSWHIQDQLLENLTTHLPELKLCMLTRPECAEPLERRAACTETIHHIRGGVGLESISDWLRENFDVQAPEEETAPEPAKTSQEDDQTVLHGITRRFETKTPRLTRMLQDLEIAAQHNVTMLLIGETGSGKTFLSQLIHEVSPRRDEPFLPVACGALPAELIESELFGHV